MNQSQTQALITEEKEMNITPNILGMAKAYWALKCCRAGLRKKSVEVDNGIISYWVGGKSGGDILLMLQGAGPNSPADWYMQVSAMAREFYLIMPDLMWFGDSIAAKDDYSPEFQAEAVKQLIDQLGIETFNVMGHSYGGIMAMMLASKLSGQVSKVIVVSSIVSPYPQWNVLHQRILDTNETVRISDLIVPADGSAMKNLYRVSFYSQMHLPDFVFNWIQKGYNVNPQQRRAMIEYIERNGEDLFGNSGYNITQDTLLIYGKHDMLIPLELGRYAAKVIGPNARLEVFADTAHCPNREKPKEFNMMVIDFLNS